MKHDVLADMFSAMKNRENIGKQQAAVPETNLIKNVLEIMKKHEYIKDFAPEKGMITITLNGKINDCNVIKPRFSVKSNEFIKWEKRFLPSYGAGILILSSSKGVMDHRKAREEGAGGVLLGYVY